jgi:hypothetical protein
MLDPIEFMDPPLSYKEQQLLEDNAEVARVCAALKENPRKWAKIAEFNAKDNLFAFARQYSLLIGCKVSAADLDVPGDCSESSKNYPISFKIRSIDGKRVFFARYDRVEDPQDIEE